VKNEKTVVFSYADNDVNSGIARMKSLFKNDVILIDKSCVILKKQLLGYRYEQRKESRLKKTMIQLTQHVI